MSDITQCSTMRCSLKATCYRFLATPSYMQSWSEWTETNGKCDGHMPVDPTSKKWKTIQKEKKS